MNAPEKLNQMFRAPKLTKTRIFLGLAVAATADAFQFFTGPLGWAGVDQVIDVVALVLTAWTLGFHLLLLPTFIAEFLPVMDMLPTWTACVIAVIALRKREQSTPPPSNSPMKSANPPAVVDAAPPATKPPPVIDLPP